MIAFAAECQSKPLEEQPIRVAVAGTTCTDHSAMGLFDALDFVSFFVSPINHLLFG